jgi:multicomponent Na+:H+ antiporter subunit E
MERQLLFRHPEVALLRAIAFALVWLVLVGPDAASWLIGAPVVVAATLASPGLSEPKHRTLSLRGLFRFVPYFLWESLRGGLDVAARVMVPHMRVRPGTRPYRVRLRSAPARLVFIDSISLLPGTLSADLRGDLVTVHALDVRSDFEAGLMVLERRVASLFGESLDPDSVGSTANEAEPSPEVPR